jgi:hypothetical protein
MVLAQLLREADFTTTLFIVKGFREKMTDEFPFCYWQSSAHFDRLSPSAHLDYSVVNDLLNCKCFEVTKFRNSTTTLHACQGSLCFFLPFYPFFLIF